MKLKKIFFIIYVVIVGTMLTGCSLYKGYVGEHPELYTVAVNLLPDVRGYIHSEVQHPSVVEVIEEDEYGRVMFCYYDSGLGGFRPLYILVCQYSDEDFSYFYLENSYMSGALAKGNEIHIYGSIRPSRIDNPRNGFSVEFFEQVRVANDWNTELDLEKSVKVPITRVMPNTKTD